MADLICGKCAGSVEKENVIAFAGEWLFHAACFKCAECKKSLDEFCGVDMTSPAASSQSPSSGTDDPSANPTKNPYCVSCFAQRIKAKKKCCGCKAGYKWNENIIRANHRRWHEKCIKCTACRKLITREYLVHKKKHYCSPVCRSAVSAS